LARSKEFAMWRMHDGWGWWMATGWLWMIVIWGLIIWAIARIAAGGSRSHRDRSADATPLEILERRYASGELTDEQFEAMRRRLTARPANPDDRAG
jgi:putative membrane protein